MILPLGYCILYSDKGNGSDGGCRSSSDDNDYSRREVFFVSEAERKSQKTRGQQAPKCSFIAFCVHHVAMNDRVVNSDTQMVEREETSLVKGFNSNPDHLLSALSQVRILPRQKPSDFLSLRALLWKNKSCQRLSQQ